MKMLKTKIILLAVGTAGIFTTIFADFTSGVKNFFSVDNSPSVLTTTNVLVPIKNVVDMQELQNAIAKIQADFKSPVFYPSMLPKPANGNPKYFISYMVRDHEFYVLSFDYAKDCNGAKYCTALGIMGDAGAKKQRVLLEYGHNHKLLTETIALDSGIKAYYTRAHAMGDYFPPMIVWDNNNVRYEIDWDGKWVGDNSSIFAGKKNEIERTGLIGMANSVAK